MKTVFKTIAAALLILLVSSCNNKPEISIKGEIKEAAGKQIIVEKISPDGLKTVDSVTVSGKGKFTIKLPKESFPQFYSLRIKDVGVFVVTDDSTNTIIVKGSLKNMPENLVFQGSAETEKIRDIDVACRKHRDAYAYAKKTIEHISDATVKQALIDEYVSNLKGFKDSIGLTILRKPWSMSGYYLLYQRLNNESLFFSPFNNDDYRFFAAAATSFNTYRKNDPRTEALYFYVTDALKERKSQALQNYIAKIPASDPDISLPDVSGRTITLSDLKGKVVVLNFWHSGTKACRLWNADMKPIYTKYKNKGLEVYQVSLEKSHILWEDAVDADGLSWISVNDEKSNESKLIGLFNVKQVPLTYLLNKKGEIIGRYDNMVQLEQAIAKAL